MAAFAPASHITLQVKAAGALTKPGGGLSALGGLILVSAAADSSAVHLSALLNPPALALVPAVEQKCLGALAAPTSWGGLAPAAIQKPGTDPAALYRVLDGMNPALKIGAPVLILQGTGDTTVFPALTNMLDTELTNLGDAVDYKTFTGVTHGGIVTSGYAAATTWLGRRFR